MKKLLFILFLFQGLLTQAQERKRDQDTTFSFLVMGNCDMCKKRIEEAAAGKGVSQLRWDPVLKELSGRYQPRLTSLEKIHERVAEAGHDTPLRTAAEKTYNGLPDCCHYRAGQAVAMDDQSLYGVVLEVDDAKHYKPLAAASIQLGGTEKGTTTNENGYFQLKDIPENGFILVSYAGLQASRIDVQPGQHLSIVLNSAKELQEVRIIAGKRSFFVSPAAVLRTQVITEKELTKAACCNLSESFETNASVDVAYNDGVTGTKQIQLLGLAGQYSLLTVENMPGPRGLAITGGLNSIPGPWVENIQLTKGPGSVVNGPEGLAGQVNVELKKPENTDTWYLNGYLNNMGKADLNLQWAKKLNKKWSTGIWLHHAFLNNNDVDFNEDGYRDIPTGNLTTILNRWRFDNGKGMMAQASFRWLTDDKVSGATNFDPEKHQNSTSIYGVGMKADRWEVSGKWGYVFPQKKYQSLGLQVSWFQHEQTNYFGIRPYSGEQNNWYSNLIYQSIFSNTNHRFKTGLSFTSDQIQENYLASAFQRNEQTTGAFFEYTGQSGKQWEWVLGIRGDQNNLYGFYLTPRIHLRYQPATRTTFRLSLGRGQRTANVLAENMAVLASSRLLQWLGTSTGKAYGLDPEVSWTAGLSWDQRFRWNGREAQLGIDLYHTVFQNQVVVDLDQSARTVEVYNLKGPSVATGVQADFQYPFATDWEFRMAYRFYRVMTTYQGKWLEKPFVPQHRAFINLAYTPGRWKLDWTTSLYGSKRIPFTGDNPSNYEWEDRSPAYLIMNAQISRSFGKKEGLEWYIGVENAGNFFQNQVLIAPEDPFGPYFDASLVWGPLTGRMWYTGFRFRSR